MLSQINIENQAQRIHRWEKKILNLWPCILLFGHRYNMNYLCSIMALGDFVQICPWLCCTYQRETGDCFVNLRLIFIQMSRRELFERIPTDKVFIVRINSTDSIADIKDVFSDNYFLHPTYWLLAVLIAGFSLFAAWIIRNSRRKVLPSAPASPIGKNIRKGMNLLSKTHQDAYSAPVFYANLHRLLLDMLSEKFADFRYVDSVSPDIQSFLEGQTDASVSEPMKELLTTIQMVKFAGFRPDISRAFEDLAKAKTILDSLINTEPLMSKRP